MFMDMIWVIENCTFYKEYLNGEDYFHQYISWIYSYIYCADVYQHLDINVYSNNIFVTGVSFYKYTATS